MCGCGGSGKGGVMGRGGVRAGGGLREWESLKTGKGGQRKGERRRGRTVVHVNLSILIYYFFFFCLNTFFLSK